MKHPLSLVSLVMIIFLTGCHNGTDNQRIKVFNQTDREIVVYYVEEEPSPFADSEPIPKQRREAIPSGESAIIRAQVIGFDADITVEYGGLLRVYSVDERIVGQREVTIKTTDFVSNG